LGDGGEGLGLGQREGGGEGGEALAARGFAHGLKLFFGEPRGGRRAHPSLRLGQSCTPLREIVLLSVEALLPVLGEALPVGDLAEVPRDLGFPALNVCEGRVDVQCGPERT
jgi:hypothetical protein